MNATAMQITGPSEALPATHPAQAISASPTATLIERAVRDPSIDVDRLERLISMHERAEARRAEDAFNIAMKNAQGEMRRVSADMKNSQTNSRYASYAALDRALRPIYTAHGFSISFDEGDTDKSDHIRVLAYVAHEAGHTRTYRKDMPADGKGAKGGDVMTKTHAAGAAASYGARYLLKNIFNVAVGEDDRDGNDPTPSPAITGDQAATIREMIDSTGADIARFCRHLGIEGIATMPAAKYEQAVAALRSKGARR